MKGDPLPPQDHVSRFCGFSKIDPNTRKPTAEAFELRRYRNGTPREKGVSVNWLEHLNLDNRAAEIAEIRKILAEKFGKSQLPAEAKIAVLNVQAVKSHVKTNTAQGYELEILHDPSSKDPSHSVIFDTDHDRSKEKVVSELISQAVHEVFPSR